MCSNNTRFAPILQAIRRIKFAWTTQPSDNRSPMGKRRQPPLFEVLGGSERRAISARPVPVQVRVAPQPSSAPAAPAPASQASAAPTSGPGGAKRLIVLNPAAVLLIVAGVLLLGFTVWYMAFRMGENSARGDKAKEREATFPPPPVPDPLVAPLPAGPGAGPGIATGPGPGNQTPTGPRPEQPGEVLADPRQPGTNYLHVDTLVWKDAERAVAFLTKGGIPAGAAPSVKGRRSVDPKEARDKNLPHVIFVLEGIPSGQYKASEARRNELVERVRRLGKRWQTEEKGPSDFASPYWAKFDG